MEYLRELLRNCPTLTSPTKAQANMPRPATPSTSIRTSLPCQLTVNSVTALHCQFTVTSLSIHFPLTVNSLSLYCHFIVISLSFHCKFTVISSYDPCSPDPSRSGSHRSNTPLTGTATLCTDGSKASSVPVIDPSPFSLTGTCSIISDIICEVNFRS